MFKTKSNAAIILTQNVNVKCCDNSETEEVFISMRLSAYIWIAAEVTSYLEQSIASTFKN